MTFRMSRVASLVAAVWLCSAAFAVAQDKPVTATDAWIRLPAPGETSTVAFASVSNPGMYAIYILTATTDIAGKVELRDAKKGTAAVDEVVVLQYETTYMGPNGAFLYLSDLKRPLTEGEKVWITMKTDTGEAVEVEAVVKKP